MMVLITYDVNTETEGGRTRLRKVAKQCKNFGQRVQNSVFECVLDPSQMKLLQTRLEEIINLEKDSLRYYYMGNDYKKNIVHVGAKPSIDVEGTIIV